MDLITLALLVFGLLVVVRKLVRDAVERKFAELASKMDASKAMRDLAMLKLGAEEAEGSLTHLRESLEQIRNLEVDIIRLRQRRMELFVMPSDGRSAAQPLDSSGNAGTAPKTDPPQDPRGQSGSPTTES